LIEFIQEFSEYFEIFWMVGSERYDCKTRNEYREAGKQGSRVTRKQGGRVTRKQGSRVAASEVIKLMEKFLNQ